MQRCKHPAAADDDDDVGSDDDDVGSDDDDVGSDDDDDDDVGSELLIVGIPFYICQKWLLILYIA